MTQPPDGVPYPCPPAPAGGYTLAEEVGDGASGKLFRAWDAAGAAVAVRFLPEDLAVTPGVAGALVPSVWASRRVGPYGVARVLGADLDGPRPYVVSEWVDGPALQESVAVGGPLAGVELERLATATAAALAAIHDAGTLHADLRPANVLLGPDGPRLVDFGLAAALDLAKEAVDPSLYMAPEQAAGQAPTAASDVYAWGAVLAFAATGRPPRPPEERRATDPGHGEEPAGPLRADGPSGPLGALVARCLDPDPERRPAAATVLRSLLGWPQDTGDPREALEEAMRRTTPAGREPAPSSPEPAPPGWASPPSGRPVRLGPPAAPGWTHPADAHGHAGFGAGARPGRRPGPPGPWLAAALVIGAAVLGGAVVGYVNRDRPSATGAVVSAVTPFTVPELPTTTPEPTLPGGERRGALLDTPTAPVAVACNGDVPPRADHGSYPDGPERVVDEDFRYEVEVTTSCGSFTIRLDPEAAPETVNSFLFLAGEGFYDSTWFHRITAPEYGIGVIQGGDPLGDGDGGPGYTVEDEFPASPAVYGRYSVAMAKSDEPDSTGSQFFVSYTDNRAGLNPRYNPVGQIVAGTEVIDRIAVVPLTGPSGQEPAEAVWIERMEVSRTPAG